MAAAAGERGGLAAALAVVRRRSVRVRRLCRSRPASRRRAPLRSATARVRAGRHCRTQTLPKQVSRLVQRQSLPRDRGLQDFPKEASIGPLNRFPLFTPLDSIDSVSFDP